MYILTFQTLEGLQLGVKTNWGVLDLSAALKVIPPDGNVPEIMEELLQMGEKGICLLQEYMKKIESKNILDVFLNEDSLKYGPCVPRPGKIIGVGLNYQGYLKESNTKKPNFPYIFTKFSNAVRANKDLITIPFNSMQVDFEAELGIVIGKKARTVSVEDALEYVIGFCNVNDFSARDLQYSTPSWTPGKCCDGFCPIGPYLVTKEEIKDPNHLAIKAYVNGELRQNSNTSDMIFNCRELVSKISKFFTLEPGDIILTGTPEGIIMTDPEEKQVWLQEGDEIIVEIEKLGQLVNKMEKEALYI